MEPFIRGSTLALPLESGTADLVITLDVVQHLPLNGGDRAALREMRRVLKPRGGPPLADQRTGNSADQG